MTVVRDQIFPQKPRGSRFQFSRTGVQPSLGSSTIELPSAFPSRETRQAVTVPFHSLLSILIIVRLKVLIDLILKFLISYRIPSSTTLSWQQEIHKGFEATC